MQEITISKLQDFAEHLDELTFSYSLLITSLKGTIDAYIREKDYENAEKALEQKKVYEEARKTIHSINAYFNSQFKEELEEVL